MQPVVIVKDERFTEHLEGFAHIESPKRIRAIHSMLQDPSLEGKWLEVAPRRASTEELSWVHTPDYIERVAQSAGRPITFFDLDTPASAQSYDVARLAVGAVFSLLDEIFKGKARRGFAFIRPPGHHAEPDKTMGFCLFNNIALGARYLKEHYPVGKVMIVDIDVHHGNGTQRIFYDSDEVLFVSTHQFPFYPGTGNIGEVGSGKGEGFTVNIPLSKGRGDREFAEIIHLLVDPLAQEYCPEIILVSCGFDLYVHDLLGGMTVTPQGYGLMTSLLLGIAEKVCNGRIAFVLEGGYNLRGIRECSLRVMQELCDVPTLNRKKIEKIKNSKGKRLFVLKKVLDVQRNYWGSLVKWPVKGKNTHPSQSDSSGDN